jgi:hypothetical protein
LLGPVEARQEDAGSVTDLVGDHGAVGSFELEGRQDQFIRRFEQFFGERDQLIRRQPAVPSSIASVSAYEIPARNRIMAVFSFPSLIAIASALLKLMPRISRASR